MNWFPGELPGRSETSLQEIVAWAKAIRLEILVKNRDREEWGGALQFYAREDLGEKSLSQKAAVRQAFRATQPHLGPKQRTAWRRR
jgi:hypothetical protein